MERSGVFRIQVIEKMIDVQFFEDAGMASWKARKWDSLQRRTATEPRLSPPIFQRFLSGFFVRIVALSFSSAVPVRGQKSGQERCAMSGVGRFGILDEQSVPRVVTERIRQTFRREMYLSFLAQLCCASFQGSVLNAGIGGIPPSGVMPCKEGAL